MRTPASIAKHPIHPMLVTVPIGLWIFSFVCDLTFVLGSGASLWYTLSFWTIIGGIAGAVLAAVPGTIDMLSLKGATKKIALTHAHRRRRGGGRAARALDRQRVDARGFGLARRAHGLRAPRGGGRALGLRRVVLAMTIRTKSVVP